MALSGFNIDKRAIAQMTHEIQREFNKHPIRVPVEADAEGWPEAQLSQAMPPSMGL